MSERKPVGIIGGGPAGLAAAVGVIDRGYEPVLFEEGEPHRKRSRMESLGSGIGGAGLFSDGKFSYFPSGSLLYRLTPTDALRKAYERIEAILAKAGIATEPFPPNNIYEAPEAIGFHQKDYPSHYGSLDARYALMDYLSERASGHIHTATRVTGVDLERRPNPRIHFVHGNKDCSLDVSHIILAMGRFGSLALGSLGLDDLQVEELRYEAGVRIEAPAHNDFFSRYKNPDVKLKWRKGDCEYRTFCVCRHGEIWAIDSAGLVAVSGRADAKPTLFSNFGLLVRFEGKSVAAGRRWWQEVIQAAGDLRGHPIWMPLPQLLDGSLLASADSEYAERPWFPQSRFVRGNFSELLPLDLYGTLRQAVMDLVEVHPELLDPRVVCIFPMIEGVGRYLSLDTGLRMSTYPISVAGDQAGWFRGLIPALVSGYFVGSSVDY